MVFTRDLLYSCEDKDWKNKQVIVPATRAGQFVEVTVSGTVEGFDDVYVLTKSSCVLDYRTKSQYRPQAMDSMFIIGPYNYVDLSFRCGGK